MKLTEKLPRRVEIGGESVSIRTDFRVWIRYEQMLRYDRDATVGDVLRLVYGDIPNDPEEALRRAEWFYVLGDQPEGAGAGSEESQSNYDFDVDADVIYASFLACYGIDLYGADLHWWTFRSLMHGLPDCAFRNRIECRTADISKLDSKSRAAVLRVRERYPLPEMIEHQTQADRDAAFMASVQRRYAEVRAAHEKATG